MAIPLILIPNSQNEQIGAIQYSTPLSSPWVSLLSGAAQAITIPEGSRFVRFAYDQGLANVYSSPDAITIPTAGSTEFSRAETNALVRFIGDLPAQSITALNLISDAPTTVHLYFYN